MIDLVALTQGSLFVSGMYFFLGHNSKKYQIKFFLWSIGFIQLLTLPAYYFVAEQSGSILPLLRVNMWINILIGFGIGMFVLFNHAVNTMDPLSDFENPEQDHLKTNHFKKKNG